MHWRIKLAAWLLKAYAVKKEGSEVLIFADQDTLDFEAIYNIQEASPNSVPVTFIPVRLKQGVPIKHSLLSVVIPKA